MRSGNCNSPGRRSVRGGRNWCHDDRVVENRIGAQFVIPLERHDEACEILARDRIDRSAITENSPNG